MKIALIVSEFNKEITAELLKSAEKALVENKISKKEYDIFWVPGAFEIPFMAMHLAESKKYDGIIALGAIIKGETDHYKAVCEGVTYGIQKVSIENHLPIMFGVLMCTTQSQAKKRLSKGYECVEGLIKISQML